MSDHLKPGEITRRAAVGGLAAAGVGFALFGPRGERDATLAAGSGGKRRIVLDYWEKWTRHEGDAMRRVVDLFNQSQDRIHVRYVVTADIGQKSMVAIAGGAPPDLIGLYAFNVPGYAESGALHPLDEIAPKFGVTLDQYAAGVRGVMVHAPPGAAGTSTLRVESNAERSDARSPPGDADPIRRIGVPKIPGVPGTNWWACVNTAGSVALYYSKAAFREVGLDAERGPRTIAELDEFHKRLTKRRADGSLERVGFLHAEPGWWSWIWAYHFGGSIYDRASDRARADSPENIAAMEWMQRYFVELGIKEWQTFRESFGNYFTPENPFLTGKVAMIVQGPWVANLIGAFKPDFDYGVCAFPTVNDGMIAESAEFGRRGTQRGISEVGRDVSGNIAGFGSSDDSRLASASKLEAASLRSSASDSALSAFASPPIGHIDTDVIVIPRGARNPEASMEFIAWTQRQDMTEMLATAHCKPSPLAKASDEFLARHPNRGVQVHYDIFRSDRAFLAPRTRVWQQYKDEFDTSVQRLWRNEEPAAEAMRKIQPRAQGFLDRAADERRRRGGA